MNGIRKSSAGNEYTEGGGVVPHSSSLTNASTDIAPMLTLCIKG